MTSTCHIDRLLPCVCYIGLLSLGTEFNHLQFSFPFQRLTGSPNSGLINVEVKRTSPLSIHLKTVVLVLASIRKSNPLPIFDNLFFDSRSFSAPFKRFPLIASIAQMPCHLKCLSKRILVKRLSMYSLWPSLLERISTKRMATAPILQNIDVSVASS